MTTPTLPRDIDVRSFDDLHDQQDQWRAVIESIARDDLAETGSVRQEGDSTTLVALLGTTRVLKLFPPFLRDHFEYESVMLDVLHGRLSLPTPRKLAVGERDGWPYLVMSQLGGDLLTQTWKTMTEEDRCTVLGRIGSLTKEVHALPTTALEPVSLRWGEFIAAQRAGCLLRQQRTKLPEHLLAQVDAFVAGPLPEGPSVALTGEYTPMNLFTRDQRLAAMFDFGDGLVGPRQYDWLGPLAFLCAGQPNRVAAYFDGYGERPSRDERLALMRLLLLHRYSNLRAQVAAQGWREARDFAELAQRLFP
jgi:hygromycin-B 7''-O-kinase